MRQVFDWLDSQFSNGTYEYEVLAAGASGDLGYIVGIEHSSVSIGGAEPEAYELRVTTICRRENGEWKVVHRHADPKPIATLLGAGSRNSARMAATGSRSAVACDARKRLTRCRSHLHR